MWSIGILRLRKYCKIWGSLTINRWGWDFLTKRFCDSHWTMEFSQRLFQFLYDIIACANNELGTFLVPQIPPNANHYADSEHKDNTKSIYNDEGLFNLLDFHSCKSRQGLLITPRTTQCGDPFHQTLFIIFLRLWHASFSPPKKYISRPTVVFRRLSLSLSLG